MHLRLATLDAAIRLLEEPVDRLRIDDRRDGPDRPQLAELWRFGGDGKGAREASPMARTT